MNPHQDADQKQREKRTKTAAIIGLGNIGSPLVGLIARLPFLKRLIVLDRDVYEEKNRATQAISARDVNRPKAFVQAERARAITPELALDPIHDAIENVPIGALRADILLTCLDSKISRQYVNALAWRLGIPWVDAGVLADALMARITVYVPNFHAPCLECSWDARSYKDLEIERPCQAPGSAVAPTNAPAHLGSLAASLQATECAKILSGSWHSVAVGRQILIDASSHKLIETAYRRNPRCRFDHHLWRIHRLQRGPGELTIGQTLQQVTDATEDVTIRVEGKAFHTRLRCECGEQKPLFYLQGRMPADEWNCPRCKHRMAAIGFDMLPRASVRSLSGEYLSQTLASIGFRPGDVFIAAGNGPERYYELINNGTKEGEDDGNTTND